jgi:hypothetical protein
MGEPEFRVVKMMSDIWDPAGVTGGLALRDGAGRTITVEWGEPANPYNPAGGTRHGHEGFLEWLRVGNASEEVLTLEPKEFLANLSSVAVVGYTVSVRRRPS